MAEDYYHSSYVKVHRWPIVVVPDQQVVIYEGLFPHYERVKEVIYEKDGVTPKRDRNGNVKYRTKRDYKYETLYEADGVTPQKDEFGQAIKQRIRKFRTNDKGFYFSLPWVKKTFIAVVDRSKDIPAEKCTCKDNIEVTVDIAVKYKIVDAVKFYRQPKVGEILNNSVRGWIKLAVCEVNSFEARTVKLFEKDEIQKRLRDFRERYGIDIFGITIQNVKLPQKILEANEKREAEKAQAEAEAIKRENIRKQNEEDATSNARVVGINATAQAEAIQIIRGTIRNENNEDIKTLCDGVKDKFPHLSESELMRAAVMFKSFMDASGTKVDNQNAANVNTMFSAWLGMNLGMFATSGDAEKTGIMRR